MTLELNAEPGEVMKAVEILHQYCLEKKISEKTTFSLKLALEECGSNIVNHALKQNRNEKFLVIIKSIETEIVIELRDKGEEFDPTRIPVSESKPDNENQIGGWGLGLVNENIDEIIYRRNDSNSENILILKKKLET